MGWLVALDSNRIKTNILEGLPDSPREEFQTGSILGDWPFVEERLDSRILHVIGIQSVM
jgi:hypothetical protein